MLSACNNAVVYSEDDSMDAVFTSILRDLQGPKVALVLPVLPVHGVVMVRRVQQGALGTQVHLVLLVLLD